MGFVLSSRFFQILKNNHFDFQLLGKDYLPLIKCLQTRNWIESLKSTVQQLFFPMSANRWQI